MSREAEQSVLGACLLDVRAYHRVAPILSAEDFQEGIHKRLWDVFTGQVESDSPTDAIAVLEASERLGVDVGGSGYVIQLASETPGTANAEGWARIVRDHATRRKLKTVATALLASEKVGEEALEEAHALLATVESRSLANARPLREVLREVYRGLSERIEGASLPVTPTPWRGLTRKLGGGFGHSHLVIAAGRPGAGKTAFARDCAFAAAKTGPVLVISLEMAAEELGGMMISAAGKVPYSQIRQPAELDDDGWTRVVAGMQALDLPIFIADQPSLSLPAISAEARRMHAKKPLSLLVIDYLGLVDLPQSDRHDLAIGTVTRGLKKLAKELRIPILLLCQLSRKVEERADKRPMLSDLRDAGQIEQDADVVILLYRDKYYNDPSPYGDIAEVNVAKQRHGSTGVVPVVFGSDYVTFQEYEGQWPITVQNNTNVIRGFGR